MPLNELDRPLASAAAPEPQPKKKLFIDRRADELAQRPGDPDDLLTAKALAKWFGVSDQWVRIGRAKGYGPPYVKLAPRAVRYRRDAVQRWLLERSFLRSNEYTDAR